MGARLACPVVPRSRRSHGREREPRPVPRRDLRRHLTLFVDSSALIAYLATHDVNHTSARRTLADVREREELVTHAYVIVEATALVQRRLGPAAVRELHEDVLAPVETIWVDSDLHQAGVIALLAAAGRRFSFVDWVSFEFMRQRRIERAFAFDRDFAAQGFETVP